MQDASRQPPAAKSRTGTKKPAAEKIAARVASARKVAVPARKVAARKTYGVVAAKKGRTVSAASLLGVKRGERKQSLTAMEWISLIRQGIPERGHPVRDELPAEPAAPLVLEDRNRRRPEVCDGSAVAPKVGARTRKGILGEAQ